MKITVTKRVEIQDRIIQRTVEAEIQDDLGFVPDPNCSLEEMEADRIKIVADRLFKSIVIDSGRETKI